MQNFEKKITHPLVIGCPPVWASGWGHDEYGIWLAFTFKEIEQRLRWIPPGQFVMGSPEKEGDRYDDERQHQVTLTRGYWLFDTPVTQALWQAVMGKNPSHFKGADHPVEGVSWQDCVQFMKKLNREVSGLDLQLPSEAQWEYACRAGTTAATYAGDLENETEPAVLKEIAWYGKNSGSKTHPVAKKKANSWGLYDMLGNVHEWCADWWQTDFAAEAVIDPTGPGRGTERVIRGGSWFNDARHVRAAYRRQLRPWHALQRPWLPLCPSSGGRGRRRRRGRASRRSSSRQRCRIYRFPCYKIGRSCFVTSP